MTSEHLATLASQIGASEALIRRSVEARAAAAGVTPDEIVAAWTGGASTPTPTPQPTSSIPAATTPVEVSESMDEVESLPEAAPTEPPAATAFEPKDVPTVEPVGSAQKAAGGSGFSSWMVAAFLIIPLFGLLYLVVNSNGVACGEGGRLEIAFDGSLVNCDGSPFEGRGGGGAEAAAFLAMGQEIYSAGAQCASCHGANGQGGTGPAMSGGAVLETWPSCDDQITWIGLGSNGWSVDVGGTYGAQAKPVQGGMPAFQADLSEEQIRAVAAFERIRFGGAPAEETLLACGLLAPDESTTGTEPAAGES